MAKTTKSLLHDLKRFFDKARVGSGLRGNAFSLCLKAAVAKAYDFATYAYSRRAQGAASFLAPTLRGVCEDVIIFGFVRAMARQDRETLFRDLMMLDMLENLNTQAEFFRAARPYQRVLSPGSEATGRTAQVEDQVRSVWRKYGWNLNRGTMPQIRQVAERQGQPVLATLYDFMYRLTSGMVHFSPGVLLRSGWGHSARGYSFSPHNFDRYYLLFAQTYSVYLLCLHFEFLRRFLRPSSTVARTVRDLQENLRLEPRWPEMITFEEMNMQPPKQEILADVARIFNAVRKRRKSLLS